MMISASLQFFLARLILISALVFIIVIALVAIFGPIPWPWSANPNESEAEEFGQSLLQYATPYQDLTIETIPEAETRLVEVTNYERWHYDGWNVEGNCWVFYGLYDKDNVTYRGTRPFYVYPSGDVRW